MPVPPKVTDVPTAPSHRGTVLVLCGAALVAWCGWTSGFHRSTTSAEVTWAISLSAVVVVDLLLWQGRHGRHPGLRLEPVGEGWPRPGRRRLATLVGLSPWGVLSLVVLVWEILGIDTGRHEPHLTISALTEAFRPLNAATLLVWLWVGVGYGAARARAPVPAPPAPPGGDGGGAAAVFVLVHPWVQEPALVTTPALLLPANRGAGVVFWVAVVAAALCIELVARRSNGRIAGVGEVVRYLSGPPVARILLVAAWVFAGYHLFAR